MRFIGPLAAVLWIAGVPMVGVGLVERCVVFGEPPGVALFVVAAIMLTAWWPVTVVIDRAVRM